MNYQYSITKCDGYLRVEVNGTRRNTDVTQQSLKLWKEVADHCKANKINLILAVFNLTGIRSLVDTFNIVEGVQDWTWPELAIAYVDTDLQNRNENFMAEQSAMMHGINFRAFLNENDAVSWLRGMYPSHK